jgi:cysteine desulfurase/selenocysteine lyase
MNREDFLILNDDIIYFDNGATTLKPKCVSEKISEYYNYYSANAHRGDYELSLKVDSEYENTRKLVKEFINAKSTKEIVFTSGATDSLNKIIFGYFKNHLTSGDEVLLTKSEHASLILPWFELKDSKDIKISYIPLTDNHKITLDNLKKAITPKTKVISIAHITNVIGDIRPIKEIISYAHENNILVVIDGAQSVAHMGIDVQELDIDFLAFSAHKMLGPTGVGVLYGKEELLKNTKPIIFGGGMNSSFLYDGTREYHEIPTLLEAGTPNISGVIGFSEAINYLNKIGMKNILEYEKELKEYAILKLKTVKDIILYNEDSESGIITFNIKDVFAQDLAIYLSRYNICLRAGNHCAKILNSELGIKNTCRISLYFYNTKKEIDKLISVLSNPNLKEEII